MGMERLAGHRVIPREPEVPSCWAEQLQAPNTDSNGHYQMQIRKFKSWLDTTYEDKVSSPKPKQMWVMLSGRGAPAAHHDRNLKTGLAKKKKPENQTQPKQPPSHTCRLPTGGHRYIPHELVCSNSLITAVQSFKIRGLQQYGFYNARIFTWTVFNKQHRTETPWKARIGRKHHT